MKPRFGDRVLIAMFYVIITLSALFCLLPFYLLFISSITDKMVLRIDGYKLWPREFSLEAYKWVLKGQQIITGYKVSVFVTVVGTVLAILFMSGIAYTMSNKKFKFRNQLAFYLYFTMIFSGGLIPWFITCREVGLYDNIWALIVPMLINPWWVFILRNYFDSLPVEVLESARIDGAGDFRLLHSIVLPLSMPALATASLFTGVAYWNDWWHGVLLLDFVDFRPLQVIILRMINSLRAIREAMKQPGISAMVDTTQLPALSVRMATVMVTIGPIVLLYPFVQRYFVRGLTLGSIKG